MDCGNLTSPINGDVLYTATLFDDCATYSCNDGYEVVGERHCGPLYNPDDGRVIYSNTTYGSQATFECDVGYEGVGASQIVCLSNASWSESSPFCRIKDCGHPVSPKNGNVAYEDTEFQAIAQYTCDTDCFDPHKPSNGTVMYVSTTYESHSQYKCDDGFDLIGGSLSTCTAHECPVPDGINNGLVNYTAHEFMSVVAYECYPGYVLVGDATRTCESNGNWSSVHPVCTIKDCGPISLPTNGTVEISDTVYRSTAMFNCDLGYTLHGNNTAECLEDGQWSYGGPSCEIKDCGPVEEFSNGNAIQAEGTTYGARVWFTCNDGYTFAGNDTTSCTYTGEWDSKVPFCQKIGRLV
ncbi:CSMD3-like protein [Mya arenaria]|uniref:CSMD3-like protein n=1 Tax=Mya arenaria TaxID=6604 RepID=A0ABY7DMY2_MYAAR|nr:CSMD3-like protein [Mya arenaria]